ncbi:MAG: RNA-guided pseudouridylation complex pseudouridine synthase subunit Cbf5 [Candidatus Aenigmatarchaeota archaeon]
MSWLYKSLDEETNPEYGKEPEKRSLEELINTSIVIVDKPSGPTSHQISYWLKDLTKVKKTGHIGTLDPFATGVLPTLIGKSTRLLPLFQKLDKEYVGIMHLHKDYDLDSLNEFVQKFFVGEIIQVPPKRSAVARVPRKRKVYEAYLIEKDGKDVLFRIICESGFYVRKWVHDIGQKLKIGAHLKELRRISIGKYEKEYFRIFQEEKAHNLIEIADALINKDEKKIREIFVPAEFCLPHIKKIFVKDSAIPNLLNGAPLYVSGIVRLQDNIQKDEVVAIFSLKNELVAFGYAKMSSQEIIKAEKGIAVRIDRVFMEKGTYK